MYRVFHWQLIPDGTGGFKLQKKVDGTWVDVAGGWPSEAIGRLQADAIIKRERLKRQALRI